MDPTEAWILDPNGDSTDAAYGGKGAALRTAARSGLSVPPWFAVAPTAFDWSITSRQRDALRAASTDDEIGAVVATVAPSPTVRHGIADVLARLSPAGEAVAVRSSAVDEDGSRHSFAGQLESFLFVDPADVADRVAAVWRSGFSLRVLAYRRGKGLLAPTSAPAVVIQRMVRADAAGVAFSADPVSGRRGVATVAAVCGTADTLVSGGSDADTFAVNRDGLVTARYHAAGDASTVLTDDQIIGIAALARAAERCFGCPQDIEWAIEDGRLWLLQSRPITTLEDAPDPDGALNIWDNSNIAESYAGVTTPLTFTFALGAYEQVYRRFCALLRVPASSLALHDATFARMLGLYRGRIYYNLLNWYRLLALLPGYRVNSRFMEQMMGVRESLPDELLAARSPASGWQRVRDGVRLLGTMGGLVMNHITLGRQIRRFYARLEVELAPTVPPLEAMRPDELAAEYRRLERSLLHRWDAPLTNDLFAMIFDGALRRLGERWCGDRDGSLHNDLLAGEGGMISAEPARLIRAMASTVSGDDDLIAILQAGTVHAIRRALQGRPALAAQVATYLDQFGDRCLEELKLESPTLADDPLPLFRAVGQMAGCPACPESSRGAVDRASAEKRARSALGPGPLRRVVFAWVLRQARRRVRDRENLRFERTRAFGRTRRIFVELAKRFRALDMLDDPHDIFYLEVTEVLGVIEGTATCTDLRAIVALRRTEFDGYRSGEAPPDRFETRGIVYQGVAGRASCDPEPSSGEERHGMGCCSGRLRGRVQVIDDPRSACVQPGAILVAERTDPGWIMLLSTAGGLLTERGSLLSHSAIVARELGIPAIVSIPGLTRWLQCGDVVEMDGSTGIVRRICGASDGGDG